MKANSIDEVILLLEEIIQTSITTEDTMGYFAALYQKVTVQVKERMAEGYFDDPQRMERLDVVFANRYLDAYAKYQKGEPISKSWELAFYETKNPKRIVLQHLLLGMNAHINLDLGIAAASISTPANIEDLQGDFNKINEVLGSLVEEIKQDLSEIWPMLLKVLKWVKKVDNFMINFSMEVARDGAWKFAKEVVHAPQAEAPPMINQRDDKIADFAQLITKHGWLERVIIGFIRMGERNKVSDRIRMLKEV